MFLEVKFHDNDFSYCIEKATEKLYNDLLDKYTSYSLLNKKFETFKEFLKYMKDSGDFDNLLKELASVEAMAQTIKHGDGPHTKEEFLKKADFYYDYIDLETEFHNDGHFCIADRNCEHIWLDIDTGQCGVF